LARGRPHVAHAAWLLTALATLGALVLADVLTHEGVVFTTTYVIVPLALALVAPPRSVALVAALALTLALASGAWNGFFASADHVVRLTVVALGGVLAALSARARQAAVDARRETEKARRVADSARRRLDAMLGSLAEAVTVHDAEGRTIYANDAAAHLLGLRSPAEVATAAPGELAARFDITREDGTPVRVEDLPGRHAVLGRPHEPLLTHSIVRATGREYWLLTKATVVTTEDGEPLAVNIIEDVTAAKEAERRERFLAEAGRLLASSLDHEETLERVARLAVPEIADWCAVDLLDDRGRLRRVALEHRDPAKVATGRELHERYPPDLEAETGIGAVLRSGVAQLYAEIGEDMLVAGARDEDHLRLTRALGMRSAIVAPMVLGERTIGVMSFVTADGGRALRESDLAFAADLARRAAVAVENARLYTERTRTAQTLQQSLLPERLPELERFRTAVSYRPGDEGAVVGGDFYDVFPTAEGPMVLLGDVTGKGVTAAALTALVRHTAKTAARFDARPGAVLRVVDAVLREQPAFSLVTMVCARLLVESADGVEAEIACAGHPLPLRLGDDGGAEAVGRGGVLLGALPDADWPEARVRLRPGDTLLFYTDGVTDVTGERERFGDERLAATAGAGSRDPDAVVRRLDAALEAFQRGGGADDRAMLAVQYAGITADVRA
jgi:PAS domain S-box-containing protein